MSSRNPEPVAAELADQIPLLKQRDGTVMWLAGLSSEAMRPHRIGLAEAIIEWLRDNGHMPKPKSAKSKRRPSPDGRGARPTAEDVPAMAPPMRNRPGGGAGEGRARS
jgi:hypothetical protein